MSKLTSVVVDAISLVKAGANGEPIQIYKAADGQSQPVEGAQTEQSPETATTTPAEQSPETAPTTPSESEVTAPVTKAKDLQALFEPFAKALGFNLTKKSSDIDNTVQWESFASRMNRPSNQISDALNILDSCLWEIFWNNQIDNGRELILQNIDEFKTFVTQVLDSNKERQTAFFTKGEAEEVKKEDVQTLISEALAPALKSVEELNAKIDALSKEDETPAAAETPNTETEPTETETPATETPAPEAATEAVHKSDEFAGILKAALEDALAPITKSISEVSARVETVENTRGLSNGLQPSSSVAKSAVVDEWPEFILPGM